MLYFEKRNRGKDLYLYMKKFLIILVVLCLVFTGAVGYAAGSGKLGKDTSQQSGQELPDISQLDVEALYKSHESSEVIGTVFGEDLLWGDYFYNLMNQVGSIQNMFVQMAVNYGVTMDWSSPADDTGRLTYADAAVAAAERYLVQQAAIRNYARENNVRLSEESEKELAQRRQEEIASYCGEGAGEEEFEKYLQDMFITTDVYDRICRTEYYLSDGFLQLYGENGSDFSDADAVRFMNDNGLIMANHILLSTLDDEGNELEEAVLKEKEETAQKIYAELMEIEDPEELIKRFSELKKEFCEDPGRDRKPDGMVFGKGEMVPEFEEAAFALEENALSEPVKSQFGYHIILRMPIMPDAIFDYDNQNRAVSIREVAARNEFNKNIMDMAKNAEIRFDGKFEKPDLLNFVK